MQSVQDFFSNTRGKPSQDTSSSRNKNGPMVPSTTGALVTVHVYDMAKLNNYTSSLGIGVYHTGVVVYGIEYCYGGHLLNCSGIFAMLPKDTEMLGPNYSYRTEIVVGRTDFTEAEVDLIVQDMSPRFWGDQYNLLRRNCNHFSDEFIRYLCGASLPKWVNRLASIGSRLPFVERSIPRPWLSPTNFQAEDGTFMSTSQLTARPTLPSSFLVWSAPNRSNRSSLNRQLRQEDSNELMDGWGPFQCRSYHRKCHAPPRPHSISAGCSSHHYGDGEKYIKHCTNNTPSDDIRRSSSLRARLFSTIFPKGFPQRHSGEPITDHLVSSSVTTEKLSNSSVLANGRVKTDDDSDVDEERIPSKCRCDPLAFMNDVSIFTRPLSNSCLTTSAHSEMDLLRTSNTTAGYGRGT